jgi:hypothetical protein
MSKDYARITKDRFEGQEDQRSFQFEIHVPRNVSGDRNTKSRDFK